MLKIVAKSKQKTFGEAFFLAEIAARVFSITPQGVSLVGCTASSGISGHLQKKGYFL